MAKNATLQDNLLSYPKRYQVILGRYNLSSSQVKEIFKLLEKGELHTGSDGSVIDGVGSHAYVFTGGKDIGEVCGGRAITLGNEDEMSSLQAEFGGARGSLLVTRFRYTGVHMQTS